MHKTDLPRHQRKPLTDLVRVLYERVVEKQDGEDASKKRNKAGRLGDFATALRHSLNQQLKPYWNVLVGNNIGFACKKRNTTMGVFRIGSGKKDEKPGEMVMVIIWKSPGIEPPSDDPPPDDSPGAADASKASKGESPQGSTNGSSAAARDFHVVQPSTNPEEGSEVERTISTLRDVVCQHPHVTDVQELAQIARRRLTSELGTIWHVAVGTDFVAMPAENCRNHVIVCVGKTMRMVCWQHEQIMGDRMDWKKISTAVPYLLVVLVCFAYMLFQNICGGDQSWALTEPTSFRERSSRHIHQRVCKHEDWEYNFGVYAVCTVAVAFFAKRIVPMLLPK